VKIAKTAEYDIRLSWTPNANRATNVPVTVRTSTQDQTFKINQREKPKDGAFQSLAKMSAEAGTEVVVTIDTRGADGHVIVDAVQLIESP
jgi:hypothetical protein